MNELSFNDFANAVKKQFDYMSGFRLFVVDTDKHILYNHYLDSFPDGTNEIFREKREYDCNYCKNFIRDVGNVVAIIDGQVVSIWDIETHGYYIDVAKSMSLHIKSLKIKNIFISREENIGKQLSHELLDGDSVKTWNHFNCEVPTSFVDRDKATRLGKSLSSFTTLKRGLEELSISGLESIVELIESDSLYRGQEHLNKVKSFLSCKKSYDSISDNNDKDIFIWSQLDYSLSLFRGSVIGTLAQDICDGEDLEDSVKSFESKVAPSNYKRPKALVTQSMIDNAISKIDELGIRDSLNRRQAITTDVSVNDILFVDRSVGLKDKDPLSELLDSSTKKQSGEIKVLENSSEIGIEHFLTSVVPSSKSIELIVSGRHSANKVQISAPLNSDSPNVLQWDNSFSWSYSGNVADSEIKTRVKSAGGAVDGVLRCSLQWNEKGNEPNNDLDVHCNMAHSTIYHGQKVDERTKGVLDIDVQNPRNDIAVENITWSDISKMVDGEYYFYVKNYSGSNINGFRSEIEFNGELYSYDYVNSVSGGVRVATVTLKDGSFTIEHHLPHTKTMNQQFIPVTMIMLSPNHWGSNSSGNKHFMFMTNEEQDTAPFRGFYNEFISSKLHEHRKVFDMLSSKMMCNPIQGGLSGYGFSSTKRTDVHAKVDKKLYLIKF